ncbi:MAG: mechanosensitive ion channel family protein [Candidatus Aminicenantales bacterium]
MRLIYSIAAAVLAYGLSLIIIQIINRRIEDLKRRHKARKFTVYVFTVLWLVIILYIWVRGGSVTTVLSVMGAGLTLALHQPVTSIEGWILILIRRPYDIGDRIELGGIRGDVIDIRLFYTSILEIGNWVDADQSTGRIVHCPNGKVFTDPIFNYTRGFEYIWNEIPVLITFESNWKKARDILLEVAAESETTTAEAMKKKLKYLSYKYMIHYKKLTPIVWVNIKDSGVELTLRYLTEAQKRRSSQDQICQKILERFSQEPDVELAYPTYRIFRRGE